MLSLILSPTPPLTNNQPHCPLISPFFLPYSHLFPPIPMEAPPSLPESAPQSQPQADPQPQPPAEQQPQSQWPPQPQQPDPLNPQVQDQSQHLQQYPQQPNQNLDYYSQNPPQVYDQSYYSYYQQYPYQNQWHYPQQPQTYAYYQPGYSAAYQQPVTHPQEPLPPAVSAPYEATQAADASGAGATPALQQPQHPQPSAYPPPQSLENAAAPPGVNPAAAAAIAALQQLQQIAGTMDAAERALAGFPPYNASYGPNTMRPPDARHPQRGRGRRGGGASRGRGRGRGPRGRGQPSSSHPEASAVAEHSAEIAAQPAPPPEKAAPKQRQVQIAWCELCRVDCTSLEILEQHKNGKRHKKNLARFEELKNNITPGGGIPTNQEPTVDPQPEAVQQPQVTPAVEEQKAAENLPAEPNSNEVPVVENNQQNDGTKMPEVPAETSDQQAQMPRLNKFDNRRLGLKRKMKGGRGGKRMKTSRPIEPPKPKVVIPLFCDLCNVKCDTREVLDRHLAGKKHIAKLKRFEGHQAMYGPQGLQVLYPPNPIAQAHYIVQGHQPFGGSVGPFPPQGGSFPPLAQQPTAGFDPQVSQGFVPQVPQATVTMEANPTPAV